MCMEYPTKEIKQKYVYKMFRHVEDRLETPDARFNIPIDTKIWHDAPGWLWGILHGVRNHVIFRDYMISRFCVFLNKEVALESIYGIDHEVWKIEVNGPIEISGDDADVGLIKQFRLVSKVEYK